ncbi:hypothetical protein E1B28_008399 [Marasmius oreades]|uniref:DUF654-domain-containing protein n=1 Tax=Marasmius oreades TaxID=181124 RepID=A0A9P7RZI7_9AGAR|nr:uncharacterized protein E1B28_008399 [Marasmius oreades]KAG7092016.1 hypothetical protein E1B28_008399 [Marasmius oreades]
MAPRLSKRQQRAIDELQELAQAGPPKAEVSDGSQDEELRTTGTRSKTGFTALLVPDEDVNEEEEEEVPAAKSSKKSKKKKKTATRSSSVAGSEVPAAILPTPAPVSSPKTENPKLSSERRAAKKAKAKAKKEKGKENDGLDEIDRALEELSMKHPDFQKPSLAPSTPTSWPTSEGLIPRLSPLLSVSLTHLDSSAELRRFFGAKVVKASTTPQERGSRGATSSSHPRRGNAKQPATERSNLTRPQAGWPPARMREGLGLKLLSEGELKREEPQRLRVEGERWWSVDYGKRYKSVTKVFLRTVLSGDPQGFYDLLYRNPWHADTLLQLSEVYRHRDEHAQAIDLIERALFAYERAFLGMGSFNFTSGVNRLDFDRVENRVFYMAVHRVVADLTRRGLSRTAFEFARLLWALDPWTDPHGALFHLEFLASKGMRGWMEDVSQVFESQQVQKEIEDKLHPTILPGWTWSRAVVMRMGMEETGKSPAEREEIDKKSTELLKEAIQSFPTVLPLLADKIDAHVPDYVRGLKECRIEVDGSSLPQEQAVLHMLSHLYVQRAWSLWKPPAISSWLSETVRNMFSSTNINRLPPTLKRTRILHLYSPKCPTSDLLSRSVWRHILVLESNYRSLIKFIPRSVVEARGLSCDPLPPPSRVTEYNTEFFAGVEEEEGGSGGRRRMTRAQREVDERRLARLVPDAGFRRQIQELFNANPLLAERIPGGVFEFAQRLAQMPPDVLDDLIAHAAAREGEFGGDILVQEFGEGGGMPGAFEDVDDVAVMGGVEGNGGGLPQLIAEEEEEEDEGDEEEDEDIAVSFQHFTSADTSDNFPLLSISPCLYG